MDFKKLESICKAACITDIEIYHVENDSSAVSTFNGEVDKNEVSSRNEQYIRGVYNGHVVSIYVEKDSDDEIEDIVSRIIDNASIIESNDPYFIYGGSDSYPTVESKTHDFDSYTQDDKIRLCKEIEKVLKDKEPLIKTCQVSVYYDKETISIVNSNGLNVSRTDEQGVVVCACTINKNGEVKQGYSVQYVDNYKDVDFDKLFKFAVERPLSQMGATSIESGKYPVVLENKAAASLIQCFTSMFSGEAVIKKMSLLKDKVDQKVFGDNITFTDDPLNEKALSKKTFDDEGVASFKKTIVENGVLKTYLHNLKTAKMMDSKSTGNGFKDANGGVGVAPSNLILNDTGKSFDEMISSIKTGVLITDLMGTHAGVNAVSGAFNLQSSGYMIENGKVTRPVTLIILSGNIVDMLNNVADISTDFDCEHRIGTGSIFVKELAVSGK